MCTHALEYVHMHWNMYTCIGMCTHALECVHMHWNVYTCIGTCTHALERVHMYWNVYTCIGMCTHVLECVPGVLFPRVNRRLFETASHLHLRRFRNKWNNAFTPIICLLGVHSNHLTYLHLYRKIHVILFSGTLAILWKATVIMAMSVRLLSAWKTWTPTGRIYMICDIWTFLTL